MASCAYGPLVRVAPVVSTAGNGGGPREVGSRDDGRTDWDEIRPIFLRGSVLSSASGSGYFEAGPTKVFCAVHGPRATPGSVTLSTSLACEIRWADFARPNKSGSSSGDRRRHQAETFATDEERELGAFLSRALSASVILDRYPKSTIDVSVFVLEDGGGSFAAAITAASLAMCDAGVEMFDLMSGCSAAVVDGRIVLDPCMAEEERCSSKIVAAYMPSLGRVTNIVQTGEMAVEQLAEAIKLCCSGSLQIAQLMRSSLERQASKHLKNRKVAAM